MARKQGSRAGITGPKVQEAALRLIARHGYAAVSMRQIAGEVGVQVGALYKYTPDKQSLLFDLMQGHMIALLDALSAQELTGDAMQRLEGFTRFHIRYHLSRTDLVFVSYMELRNLTDENFGAIEALRRRYEDVLEGILHDGVKEARFATSDSRVTTLALIALLTGVTNWYREGGRFTAAEIEQMYWELVRKSVAL